MQYRVPNNRIKLRCTGFMLFFACHTAILAQSTDSLTVRQIVEKVLHNNHALRQLSSQIAAAAARVNLSKTSYYPSVNADLSYANIGPEDNMEIHFGPQVLDMAPTNSVDAHFGANIVVFDFGKRTAGVKAARLSEQTLKDKTGGITNGIAFQAVSLATNIAMMQQGIAIQNENIESLLRHLSVVKKRLETGSGTEYDTLKTQAQLASAQETLLDLENGLSKLRITIAVLMRISPDSLHPVRISFDVSRCAVNADSALAVALRQRQEIVDARNAQEALKIQDELAKKEMLPVASASVAAGMKNGYPTDVNTLKPNWAAAVQIQVPLYDGLKTRHHRQELASLLQAADEALAEVADKVRTDVLQAIADVSTSYAKLSGSFLQVRVGQEALRLAQAKMLAGTITNDEVLDSQREFISAKLTNLQDQTRYVLSLYTLDQATGTLAVSTDSVK
jgi:outer membrane protein